jgi:predicted P-loop ATPase
LPIHTDVADIARITRDRDQLWAEALQYWREHGIAWRGLDVLAKPAREAASAMDTWMEQIAAWIDENPAPHYRMVDVMTNAVGLDSRQSTRAHELRVGRVLHSLGYARKSVRDTTGRVIKAWTFDPTS